MIDVFDVLWGIAVLCLIIGINLGIICTMLKHIPVDYNNRLREKDHRAAQLNINKPCDFEKHPPKAYIWM